MTTTSPTIDHRAVGAEFVGTAFLLAGVVGSGIMAERLTEDVGLQLLQNAVATAGVLIALITTFSATSGAHFNPAVTLAERFFGSINNATAAAYVGAQTAGGILGVMIANIMFELDPVYWSEKSRGGYGQLVAESVATLGLLLVIFGTVRGRKETAVPLVVGSYIAGAYYFTSSTSFANPAVSVARMFSNTFAGISPGSTPGFIAAQGIGLVVALATISWLFPQTD